MLTWLKDPCNKTELWLYVYYRDISVENSTWERRGLALSRSFGFVPNLITSHKYKAYMLTAHENGNGLPSLTFTFEAVESRKSKNISFLVFPTLLQFILDDVIFSILKIFFESCY